MTAVPVSICPVCAQQVRDLHSASVNFLAMLRLVQELHASKQKLAIHLTDFNDLLRQLTAATNALTPFIDHHQTHATFGYIAHEP